MNGEPQVTPDGDIVYMFPELQTTSAATSAASSSTNSCRAALNPSESWILQRAGLDADSCNCDIQRLLMSRQGIKQVEARNQQDDVDDFDKKLRA